MSSCSQHLRLIDLLVVGHLVRFGNAARDALFETAGIGFRLILKDLGPLLCIELEISVHILGKVMRDRIFGNHAAELEMRDFEALSPLRESSTPSVVGSIDAECFERREVATKL